MSTLKISSVMSPINKTRIEQHEQAKNEVKAKSLDNNGLSSGAAEALKAQVLYKKPKNNIIYLDDNLSKKEIISALKDKNKMGRSFFGYKNAIANIITKAEDMKLATKNFNILMNFDDGKLRACDVLDILLVATSINNKKMDEGLMSEYGFNGGDLNDEAINSIFDKIKEQRELQQFEMMQEQMMQQQMLQMQMINEQIMQQQMLQQQIINDQMMHQQHVMMTTPGMGFC